MSATTRTIRWSRSQSSRLFYLDCNDNSFDLQALRDLHEDPLISRALGPHRISPPNPSVGPPPYMFYNSTTRTYCGVRAPLFKIVVDIRSGGFVGYTALLWDDRNSEANRDAVLVMAVAGAWWGKGLGTEICRWTLARAFDSLALHRVSVGVFENNLRALAVCWNSGFVQEGVRRKASMVSPGRWEDVVLMGILKEDYLEEQGRAQAAESAQALEARAQDRALEREMAYALALDSEEEQGADPDVEDPDAENGVLRDTQTREDGRSPSYEHIVSEDLYDEESEESWIMASQGEERENVEEA